MAIPQLALVDAPKQARIPRSPTHRFRIDQKPWEISPVALIPVLPAETMKNLSLQVRAVTQPLKSPLIGWWLEYYVFYVTHRQLENQAMLDMMLDPTVTLPASPVSARDYYNGNGFNWSNACLNTIVKYWFREGDERASTYDIRAGRPSAKIDVDDVSQSMRKVSQLPAEAPINSDRSEEERLQNVYEFLKSTGFSKMTYEDFLESYGVKAQAVDQKRPELLRVIKDWQYPTNTINATNGAPSTAVSWSLQERADKDRYFSEPGFIAIYSVCRPKVYLGNQRATATSLLDRAFRWLPALMNGNPEISLVEYSSNDGIYSSIFGENYWLDIRDLFIHGDQWLDVEATSTTINKVALPDGNGNIKYPTLAMADGLFKTAGALTTQINSDGVIRATILGTQMDMT